MDKTECDCRVHRNEIFGETITIASDGAGMGKEERKQQVLKLLADSDLALTPYVLFRNLKMKGATFERRTLGNYLRDLLNEGRIEKLDVDGDPLYRITEKGRNSLNKS